MRDTRQEEFNKGFMEKCAEMDIPFDLAFRMMKEAQFVPMGGDPAAMPPPGGGDPAAMPPPGGDPAAMPPPGGDPAAMPPGGDPSAMPPGIDPSLVPPPGADPAAAMSGDPMAGMPMPDPGDVSPSGEPYMKITPTQLSKLFKQFAEVFKSVLGISGPQQQAAPSVPQQDPAMQQKITEIDAKLNAVLGQA